MKEANKLFDKIINHLESNEDLILTWNSMFLESAILDNLTKYYTYYGNVLQVGKSYSYLLHNKDIGREFFSHTFNLNNYLKGDSIDTIFIEKEHFINQKEEIGKFSPKRLIFLDKNGLHTSSPVGKFIISDLRYKDQSKYLELDIDKKMVENLIYNGFIKNYMRRKIIKNLI